jgi:shikimate dehydrogenase
MSDTKLFAVTGQPIFHSRSPQIFNSLFQSLRMDSVYIRISAMSTEEVIKTARAMGLSGFNVTSPYKHEIMKNLDDVEEHARTINAVNTVVADNGKWIGFNTDFIGAVETLKNNGIDPQNTNFAILGAGGAARAAAYGLLNSNAKNVTLLNRTEEHAKKAALHLGCDFAPLEKGKEILDKSDILISCIPSIQRVLNPDFLKSGLVVMDANYKDSVLIHDAVRRGCRTINGLEWLVYQALPAFHLFSGQKVTQDLQRKIMHTASMKKAVVKPNIALIGFMGTGKTTVGQLLAERKRFRFMDIDKMIEESSGKTIPEIFRQQGEKAFREIEKSVILTKIPDAHETVFSVGGGGILEEENRSILNKHCHVIWLWASVKKALKQINISSRPLLNQKTPEKIAKEILAIRIPLYAKVSDLTVSIETSNAEEIVKRINDEMG